VEDERAVRLAHVDGGRARGGVCSLAQGADDAFAEACRTKGLPYEAVIPCAGYEAVFSSEAARRRLRELRQAAIRETVLPFHEPSDEAFLAGGLVVVERSDLVVALWDGLPAKGLGGTADIVAYARDRGIPEVVWPHGVHR
jgi:hypothetical protein